MPKSITVNTNYSGDLGSGQGSIAATDTIVTESSPLTILAAQPAVLTTHTSSTAGTLTMTNSSHGITTGQRVDFFWAGGSCANVTVGTVAGTSVPFTTATGLPAATTPITVGIPVQTGFVVTGNNLTALTCTSPVESFFCFDTSTTDDTIIHLPAPTGGAGSSFVYVLGSGFTNPLATFTTSSVWMSHASTTGPLTSLQAGALAH